MTYPEHEKLTKVKDKSQAIGEFLEWLNERGVVLCTFTDNQWDGRYLPYGKRVEDLLAEFFEIDLDVLEQEKRTMLQAIRECQK